MFSLFWGVTDQGKVLRSSKRRTQLSVVSAVTQQLTHTTLTRPGTAQVCSDLLGRSSCEYKVGQTSRKPVNINQV